MVSCDTVIVSEMKTRKISARVERKNCTENYAWFTKKRGGFGNVILTIINTLWVGCGEVNKWGWGGNQNVVMHCRLYTKHRSHSILYTTDIQYLVHVPFSHRFQVWNWYVYKTHPRCIAFSFILSRSFLLFAFIQLVLYLLSSIVIFLHGISSHDVLSFSSCFSLF